MSWPVLLLERRRGAETVDVAIHGAVAWATPDRVVHERGGAIRCFGRSMLKPLMMKPLVDVLASVTTWEQRAISVASHMGTDRHVGVVRSLLPSPELLLQVPPSLPLSLPGQAPASSNAPSAETAKVERVRHPCSGQHAAIVSACALRGWNAHDYLAREHPFFACMTDALRRRLGGVDMDVATDNCGLATFALSIGDQARLMASIASERDTDWIWDAMVKHPSLVGGEGRLDTALMQACDGRVVAKEGADGLLGLALVHDAQPLGIVIKLAHGWDPSATLVIAAHLLRHLGFALDALAPASTPWSLAPDLLPDSTPFVAGAVAQR